MLLGGWGTQAGALIAQTVANCNRPVHRDGLLTLPTPPAGSDGRWCCWLFGEPLRRDKLGEPPRRDALPGPGEPRRRDTLPEPGEPPRRDTLGELASMLTDALEQQDEAACELLHGRFVRVALDRHSGRCIVARDQLGAQPLVYVQVAGGVVFAEHECQLLELLARTPNPNRLALLQWIDNGATPARHTLYEGVQRVPPGHLLRLDGAQTRVERWWELRYREPAAGTAAELAESLREAAFAAIARAAAGSRRPGVKLSGGLDSACVAAGLMADGWRHRRVPALAGTFPGYPETDEHALIEATARHTELALQPIAFDATSSMLAPALTHIARWRLPPASPNLFLWRPLMARARELGVDALLDGEGGDELFGLAPLLIADLLRTGRAGTAWSLTARLPNLGSHPGRAARLHALRHYGIVPLLPDPVRHRHAARRPTANSGAIVPRGDALALLELQPANRDRRAAPLWWQHQTRAVIDHRDLLGISGHYRREAVTERVARHHPFLHDLPLIEAVLALPPRLQFDPARDRPLLRDGLRGRIPEAVRTRHRKSHFTALVLDGIRAEEAQLIDPLRRADAPVRGYVAREALERRLSRAPAARSLQEAGSLWRIAIANRWLLAQADTVA